MICCGTYRSGLVVRERITWRLDRLCHLLYSEGMNLFNVRCLAAAPVLLMTVLLLTILPAAAQEETAMKTTEDPSLEERCRREVVELHQFFQDWFNAELTKDDASFERFEGVLAADFEIVGPNGRKTARADVLPGLRAAHGQHVGKEFSIAVREVESRTVAEGVVLVTYEEHQMAAGKPRGWQSSALFRVRDGVPNGVEWLHVHETYLPGLGE